MHNFELKYSLVACDKEAIEPDIMKTVFFGALITSNGAINVARNIHAPRTIVCFLGANKLMFFPAAA